MDTQQFDLADLIKAAQQSHELADECRTLGNDLLQWARCVEKKVPPQRDQGDENESPVQTSTSRITDLLRTAQAALTDAVWAAERAEHHALEGELLTVLAGLENVQGAVRKSPRAIRQFGEMKHS